MKAFLKDVLSDFFVPEWHNLGMGQYDRFGHLEKNTRCPQCHTLLPSADSLVSFKANTSSQLMGAGEGGLFI